MAAQAELDAVGLAADIPQATALVSLLQLIGECEQENYKIYPLKFCIYPSLADNLAGGSLGGSLGGASLTTDLRRYASSLPASTVDMLLQSVNTVYTLSGEAQTVAIEAYVRAMDNVFISGAAAGGIGFLFALLCRDRK